VIETHLLQKAVLKRFDMARIWLDEWVEIAKNQRGLGMVIADRLGINGLAEKNG